MKSSIRLGIDLGGTGIKMALVTPTGRILQSSQLSTPLKPNPKDVVALIAGEAKRLFARLPSQSVCGVGMGAAGDVDPKQGLIRLSPNLGWKNVPIKDLLKSALQLPIFIDNDANVAAWAAYTIEAKRKIKNLIAVTLGTGVGGGIVLDGRLYRGSTGSAGEIGHMTLYPDGIVCSCGNQGCLERYVGAKAMVEEARLAMAEGSPTYLTELSENDPGKLTPLMIHKAALHKDALALHLWKQTGERLGIALASLVNLLNPEWIVLTGGLSRAGNLLIAPARKTLKERCFPTPGREVRIVVSTMDQLGVVGAALIVP